MQNTLLVCVEKTAVPHYALRLKDFMPSVVSLVGSGAIWWFGGELNEVAHNQTMQMWGLANRVREFYGSY